jgi:hypothetical protein
MRLLLLSFNDDIVPVCGNFNDVKVFGLKEVRWSILLRRCLEDVADG